MTNSSFSRPLSKLHWFIMPPSCIKTSYEKTSFPNGVVSSKVSATWTTRKKITKKNYEFFNIKMVSRLLENIKYILIRLLLH